MVPSGPAVVTPSVVELLVTLPSGNLTGIPVVVALVVVVIVMLNMDAISASELVKFSVEDARNVVDSGVVEVVSGATVEL